MIGWVQAIAFAIVGVAAIFAVLDLLTKRMQLAHEREMERMKQDHEIVTAHDE